MKSLFILSVLLFSASLLQAQSLTANYLKKIPALPKDSCNITREGVENFQQKVSIAISEIENEIENLKAAEDQQSAVNEEAAKKHAMQQMSQQYGLSQQQMAQMKAGKMSDADKQALANQILQQQTNMSMGEVQNLSKMSDAGQKAYAEALGTEMMAAQQSGQNKPATNNKAGDMYKLIQDQQMVMNRINANATKIGNAYNSIDSDPELQKMRKNISSWNSKMMAMSGIVSDKESKQMDSLAVLIKTTQIKICQNYTPKLRAAIRNHYSLMQASFPDLQKLAEITASLTLSQTGVGLPAESVEIGRLETIKGYLDRLKDAYQYKLYFPEEDSQ